MPEPPNVDGGRLRSGSTIRRVDRLREVELARRHAEVVVAGLLEVVEAAEVGDPVARQVQVAAEVAAGGREREQQLEAAEAVVEDLVPVVGGADHRVAEAERGDAELDRHRRDVGRRRADLEHLAALVEDVVDRARAADPRQVVGADHPLVVLGDELAGRRELLRGRHRGRQRVEHAVVEADHRQVGLGDREVLVVARVGDDRLALGLLGRAGAAREVEAVLGGDAVGGHGLAHLEVHAVGLVELRRLRVLRPGAVERVEVEAGRARLQQRARRDLRAQHDGRLVERQVVVDELAEVGEAGRDLRRLAAAGGHQRAELRAVGLAELPPGALRPHAAEAERRRRPPRRRPSRRPSAALREQSLADDEVALRPMLLHGDLLFSRMTQAAYVIFAVASANEQPRHDRADPRLLGHAPQLGALDRALRGAGLPRPRARLPRASRSRSRRSTPTRRRSRR